MYNQIKGILLLPDRIKQVSVLMVIFFVLADGITAQTKQYYKTSTGTVEFISDAPLEIISAKSELLKGILSVEKMTFAFELDIITFFGFNSPLQNEHFNENYMETADYPKATFTGTIIESIDYLKPGIYNVRAKGIFNIHGSGHAAMLDIILDVKENSIAADSEFEILLKDYDIEVPKIVNKKIADIIRVKVHVELK
jgi:hypothetical protein